MERVRASNTHTEASWRRRLQLFGGSRYPSRFVSWDKRLPGNPVVIVFFICLILLTLNILFIGKIRPFNSDDLYWQQAVRTWAPFHGHKVYLGTKDIFVEQVPFFILMQHLFSPSRTLVLIEAVILTLAAFVLFYLSSVYFFKKLKLQPTYATLLPFVWLASFGYPLVQNYLNTDWRTFEVGLCFATFTVVAAVLFRDIKPFASAKNTVLSVIALACVGFVMYSDPYYLFFTIGPLLLFVVGIFILKKVELSSTATILAGAVFAFAIAKVFSIVGTKAGLVVVGDTPSVFVSFDNIITNIISSLHGLLIVFGADFFGRPAFGLSTFGPMINAALLAIILYWVFSLRNVLRRPYIHNLSLPQLWTVFFGGMVAVVFVIYTSTTLVMVSNYRFFIILIYCAVLFLATKLSMLKNYQTTLLISALLVGATAYNLALTTVTHSVRQQVDVGNNASNVLNDDIIRAVRAEGLTKGYASYWEGNINSYLSRTITFLPSLCDGNGQTVKFKWLVDGNQFETPASSSFYLIDPDFPAPGTCTEKQLVAQFGAPKKIVKVHDKEILVYGYDISLKIPLSLP